MIGSRTIVFALVGALIGLVAGVLTSLVIIVAVGVIAQDFNKGSGIEISMGGLIGGGGGLIVGIVVSIVVIRHRRKD